MKYKMILKVLLVGLLAQLARLQTMAQLNCDGITNMYGIFIDQARSNGNTYIAPINYSTAVIGPSITGVYTVPSAGSGGGNNAFGTTTLAAEPVTNRLFYMTGDYNSKDLYAINATAPTTKIKISDDLGSAVNSYWFVKMAVAQDGYAYSLSTKRVSPLSDTVNGNTKLIRFNSCQTANCATVDVLAVIPKASFDPFDLYNGDIAFAANGDMYIFGSALNPINNKYFEAGIYVIKKANIPTSPGTGNLSIQKIGVIPAMDSVSITGAAFDGSGNFYLAALDTVNGKRNRTHIFRGSLIGPVTTVTKIYENIIPNYIIGDLASCSFPNLMLVDAASAKLNGFNKGSSNALVWKVDGINNIRSFVVERQMENETDFKPITSLQASSSVAEYSYEDFQVITTVSSNYRIRFEKKDGTVTYSNTIQILLHDKAKTKVLVTGNPFKQTLQFDLTTMTPGSKNVVIYDNSGFIVLNEKVKVVAGMNKITIDKTSGFKKGIYVLRVYDETNSQQFKVIKD